MAGHSKFKNIMYRKGAQDAKRAKLFAKLAREISVAAKSGMPEPDKNPRLKNAIINARSENMPKDKIDKAVQKSAGGDTETLYEEFHYEGYGPEGIALIVDVLTDNRNRTASEIRSAFSKHGGTLGETGSVNFLFSRSGIIKYPISVCKADDFFDIAAESQCNDINHDEEFHEAVCEIEKFGTVRDFLSKQLGDPISAKLEWTAISPITIDNEKLEKLIKLMEALEENDDVQNVYTNIKITKENLHEVTS
jgi:YebC/PmpR family DNA-binding regulatory protein